MLYDGDTFRHNGHSFKVTMPYDDIGEAPWEREDGHGPVSEWTRRDKRPSELVLRQDGGSYRYYDFAAAVALAKRDGWNAEPYSDTETHGQRAHKAAMADFSRLRAWCNDQWQYVGVVVDLLDDDGNEIGEQDSLWGVESDSPDYIEETARDCADEILHRLDEALSRA